MLGKEVHFVVDFYNSSATIACSLKPTSRPHGETVEFSFNLKMLLMLN